MTNKNLEDISKCHWKEVLLANQKGKGTSFTKRKPEDLDCYHCNGYDDVCKNYIEGEE